MNEIVKYNLPISTKEKWVRRSLWILPVTIVTAITLVVGPSVVKALGLLVEIQGLAIAAGVVGATGFVIFSVWKALLPALKNRIAVLGYQAMRRMNEDYPIEQMGLLYDWLRAKWQKTLDVQRAMNGKLTQLQQHIKDADDAMDDCAIAIKAGGLTVEQTEEIEDRVIQSTSSKEAYQSMADRVSKALEAITMLADFNRRKVREYKRTMSVALVQHEVGQMVDEVNATMRDLFGDNIRAENAAVALDSIVRNMGQSFGELDSFEREAQMMMHAVSVDDKIALAKSRDSMIKRINTIEGVSRIVPEAQSTRLLDK